MQKSNPFISYSDEEISRITKALNKQLGPEFISKRKGPGYNNVQYLEGWKAINLANKIFGPNGWFTELKNFQVDYIDDRGGSISMGISAIVRVCLKDGTFHEDIGYGSIDNCRTKSAAFEKCKKEAVTDGMKRALRQFGNALGNCLYDKDFLQKVTKVSQNPRKFDEKNLMRVKEEIPKIQAKPTKPKSKPSDASSHIASDDDSFLFSDDWPEEINQQDGKSVSPSISNQPQSTQSHKPSQTTSNTSAIPTNVTFVCAKSAETIRKDPSLQNSLKFDPSRQSQIAKSGFINHQRSAPVKRSLAKQRYCDDNKENRYMGNKLSKSSINGKISTSNIRGGIYAKRR